MPTITDPASELARLLDSLNGNTGVSGSRYLAQNFNVEEESFEFYQIIFSIIKRIEDLKILIRNLEGFEHLQQDMENHLNALKNGFTASSLQNQWDRWGTGHINPTNIQPIKVASAFIRTYISYPNLNDEEREEVIGIAEEMLQWLRSHQIEDNDFIRQAIIDGLEAFVFRMQRLKWLGWGYSVESLRSVVTAYFALERGFVDDASMPSTEATLKKLYAGLAKVFEAVGVAKEFVECSNFILKAYGALTLSIQAKSGVVALISAN